MYNNIVYERVLGITERLENITMIDKIRIGGIDYEVKIVPDLRDGDKKLDGCAKHGVCEILIDAGLSHQIKYQTLLHEVFHTMFLMTGRELDENATDALAYQLLQVLRDNPDLAGAINGEN